MGLAGLPLSTLAAIFAGAALLVVGLYVLKLRRRALPVPFSRIWDSVLRDKRASQLFSKLRRLFSLLAQLLLLGLLVLSLGDPKPAADLRAGRHLVLLIDASASMKASDVKPSRLAAAKLEAQKIVRGLGASDRALVVEMGSVPTPLCSMSGEASELLQAIDAVQARDTAADLEAALAFAEDSLRDASHPELVVLGDGAYGESGEAARKLDLGRIEPRFVPLGVSGKNVAISEFSVRRYPLDKSRYEVMLELANLREEPVEVELELRGDGVLVDVSRMTVGAGERLPRFYHDLAGASRTLTARIQSRGDELAADDVAYALLPERRRARVLLVTPGNTYLEAALLLDEYLDVTQVPPRAPLPSGPFDVAILDNVAPELPANVRAALYLNPPADNTPVPLGDSIREFGFDTWDKKSPLLQFMALGDIQVAKGHAFKPLLGDRTIGESELGPLLVTGVRSGRRFVALGFDPRDSDWVLRIAWPLFVLNSINAFVEEEAGYISSYRTGEVWRIPVPGAAPRVNLLDPSGTKRSVAVSEGRAVVRGDLAGFYHLSSATDDAPLADFAANLADLSESRIAPVKTLTLGGRTAAAVAVSPPHFDREVWVYLLAAVVMLSLIEWLTYHRRVTV